METGFKHIDDYYNRHTPEYGTYQLEFDPLEFIDEIMIGLSKKSNDWCPLSNIGTNNANLSFL